MTLALTPDVIEFEILGLPAPQGSKTRMPNGAMIEGKSAGQRIRHKSWRAAVAEAARDIHDDHDGLVLDGALTLDVEFRFPMPLSRKKAVREAGHSPKTSAPDLDKLVRSLGDSLQAGGLIRDDARLWRITASKVEVIGWTGATVRIGVEG